MLGLLYGHVYNKILKYLVQILGWMDRDVWSDNHVVAIRHLSSMCHIMILVEYYNDGLI